MKTENMKRETLCAGGYYTDHTWQETTKEIERMRDRKRAKARGQGPWNPPSPQERHRHYRHGLVKPVFPS